ncbi:MAG TPA: DUF6596 domain-containing protein [Telluria sp.]|nr:DUF6596 domain-containing protein [Telluria sp.]
MLEVQAAIERVARDSYGRLLAFLSARSHDVAAAEDALADAMDAALRTWPAAGLPASPEAWLLVTARRKLIDAARHKLVHDAAVPTLLAVADDAYDMASQCEVFPDERLKLLFVCAHPAIDVTARTPLMLQTVLGLDAARIASALLVKPASMGQRLTRAKAKIRDARIAFDVPEASELPERLHAVLEAIYAAYSAGWDDFTGADVRRKDLATDALALGRLLLQLMPDEPEVKGLLSLMLSCESRRAARIDSGGRYVPLSEQDAGKWAWPLLGEAHQLLLSAEDGAKIGCFQLEAAIQSAHTQRAVTGRVDWEEVALLYEGIVRLSPTTGALVGRAAAAAEARGAEFGWSLLQAIPAQAVASYQPYWALACHLLWRMGRADEARIASDRAIGLCEDPAVRAFLQGRAAAGG